MTKIEELEQEIDQLKTRLTDIEKIAHAIIRDKNEMDKVFIQAEEILSICGKVGGIRSEFLYTELRKLKSK